MEPSLYVKPIAAQPLKDFSVFYEIQINPINTIFFFVIHFNIVAYLPKARTVEPEKQLLLANGSETFISKQWPQNEQQNTYC
jgi:hypothetical protein